MEDNRVPTIFRPFYIVLQKIHMDFNLKKPFESECMLRGDGKACNGITTGNNTMQLKFFNCE